MADGVIGLVIGCFAFSAMVFKPLAGWGADRFGRRPLLLAGAALFVAASAGYAASAGALTLLAMRLVHGAGMGLFPTAASTIVADLAPPDRRGELMGLYGAAANVAMAAGPLLGLEIERRAGFLALFAVATACALAAVAISVVIRETGHGRGAAPLRLGTTLHPAALPPSVVMLCLMVSYGAQVAFLPIHIANLGLNSGIFFLAFALVVALVRGWAGRLSDRAGRGPVAAGGLVVAAAGLVVLAFTQGVVTLAAAGALYGVGFGATQPTLMAWCVDRIRAEDRGRALGTLYTAWELGIAAGALASGLAVTALGFAPTFLIGAAIAVIGALLALRWSRGARPFATGSPFA